jgi:hypothetical protein
MKKNIEHLNQILTQRLKEKGVDSNKIDGLIRNLANLYFANPDMSLSQINKELQYLGWDDLELDYHTLQLLLACFELNLNRS